MSKILTVALILGSLGSNVSAQSDHAISWFLENVSYDGLTGDILELDIDLGTRHAAAHGIVIFTDGSAINTTGSCFVTTAQSVICDLALLSASVTLALDLNTLDGTVDVLDQNAELISAGSALLADID